LQINAYYKGIQYFILLKSNKARKLLHQNEAFLLADKAISQYLKTKPRAK
jgi:hypothetical protein